MTHSGRARPFQSSSPISVGQPVRVRRDTAPRQRQPVTSDQAEFVVCEQTILSSFYANTHLDAVLAMNDSIATGVSSSLRGIGYGAGGPAMPVVTGQDAEVPNVKAILNGYQTSTVFKDTRALAAAAADMADAVMTGAPVKVNDTSSYHNGVKIVPTQLLTPVLVDKSNWKEELVTKSKFYTEGALR